MDTGRFNAGDTGPIVPRGDLADVPACGFATTAAYLEPMRPGIAPDRFVGAPPSARTDLGATVDMPADSTLRDVSGVDLVTHGVRAPDPVTNADIHALAAFAGARSLRGRPHGRRPRPAYPCEPLAATTRASPARAGATVR